MIFNVCIEIFAVSSKFHQRIIDESSMKQQWNISVSETNTLKTIMIINVCIEIINVSWMLHQCRIVVSLMNRPVFWWQHWWIINVSKVLSTEGVLELACLLLQPIQKVTIVGFQKLFWEVFEIVVASFLWINFPIPT